MLPVIIQSRPKTSCPALPPGAVFLEEYLYARDGRDPAELVADVIERAAGAGFGL